MAQQFALRMHSKRDIIFVSKIWFLIFLTIISALLVSFFSPFPQDSSYHDFADKQSFFGLQNFNDVTSNVIFIVAGLYGLHYIFIKELPLKKQVNIYEKWPLAFFFISTILVGLGSAYYHSSPDNFHLLWDRLPMNLCVMALLDFVILEKVDRAIGIFLLVPLLLLALATVFYWYYTELEGQGDLRWYIWSGNYAVFMTILITWFFPAGNNANRYIVGAFFLLLLAKIFEALDKPVFSFTDYFISGHTLKHLIAGVACFMVLYYLKHRRKIILRR